MDDREGAEDPEGGHARQRVELARDILDSLGEAVVAVDGNGLVTFVNRAAEVLLGWSAAELLGSEAQAVGDRVAPLFIDLTKPLEEQREEECVTQTADGRETPVVRTTAPLLRGGEHLGSVMCLRDIRPQKAFEEELRHHAFHDALTGLANRSLFADRLAHAHARSARVDFLYSVMFVDLDEFKAVNDSLGHAGGDEVLVAVAGVLQRSVRPSDTVARFGGDEFTLLLEDVGSVEAVEGVARRILSSLGDPLGIRGLELRLSASIGIVVTDGRSVAPSECVQAADLAMYRAKANGRACYEVAVSVAGATF